MGARISPSRAGDWYRLRALRRTCAHNRSRAAGARGAHAISEAKSQWEIVGGDAVRIGERVIATATAGSPFRPDMR